jgi:hypothetical protein
MKKNELLARRGQDGLIYLFLHSMKKKYLGYDNIFKEIKKYKIQVDLIRFNIFI